MDTVAVGRQDTVRFGRWSCSSYRLSDKGRKEIKVGVRKFRAHHIIILE